MLHGAVHVDEFANAVPEGAAIEAGVGGVSRQARVARAQRKRGRLRHCTPWIRNDNTRKPSGKDLQENVLNSAL